jgi:anti-anti-sigma factor
MDAALEFESTSASRIGDEHSGDWLRVDLTTTTDGSTARLVLSGELDGTTAEQVRRCVADTLRDPAPATLEIDTRALSFIDSSGVRCLLLCRENAHLAGSRLVVSNPSPTVYQVLEITGLLDIFAVPAPHPSRTDGVRSTPAARHGMHSPTSMQELLEHSARLRKEAEETRQHAATVRDYASRLSWDDRRAST